jgi:arginyl-tRNA--protein-N-Asp/Glu arginylyltransferase
LSTQTPSLNVAITKVFPCSYLPDQKEQLLMLVAPQINGQHFYPTLLANGFRRSGSQVYRPHCTHCQACQSLRIATTHFKLSRSQKRLFNKNKKLKIKISETSKPQYFDLYQRYINTVHSDGSMFPASISQYEGFIKATWNKTLFVEIYDQDKLICVSVTDQVNGEDNRAWSAFYCFYDPDYLHHSLGTFAVLCQLNLAKEFNIDWLYLGYYIEKCQKMNYKTQFNPHQRFIDGQWFNFN